MATTITPLDHRVDADLKRKFDKTAEGMGITPTAALTVFMKRLVSGGGFPFALRGPVPSDAVLPAEMEMRYRRMLAGEDTEHGLVEA